MIWMDYIVEQAGQNFRVKGDWPGEVMGMPDPKNPTKKKDHWLYKPGDVFIVDKDGWLRKTDEVNTLLLKYEKTG